MEYRSLGRTGVMVSPLCLGAMNFGGPTDKPDSFSIIGRALEAGINFIDTANVYNAGESERIVGEALKQDGRRHRVILATKVHSKTGEGPNDQGGSRYHILRACEDSLCRLQTDHIDLYQLHRPPLAIPPDETLRAFDDLVRSGKVLYIGCSTHPAWMVMEALAVSDRYGLTRYVSEQPPYNLLDRRIENELVPLCVKHGLAILPWSPMAGGILAGRYQAGSDLPEGSRAARWGDKFTHRLNRTTAEVAAQVAAMARDRGMSAAQLALLWVKDQPAVTSPIIGPRTLAHLEEALSVLDRRLAETDRPLFDALVHPGNAIADFHSTNDWMKARIREPRS
ncbi:MAG: aldo/keto reductase [candidate division NC10 bacterium]|nr:aldo/keto reductase [candidate division NC10 bacterium]